MSEPSDRDDEAEPPANEVRVSTRAVTPTLEELLEHDWPEPVVLGVLAGLERIELHSRDGGVDIRSDGETIVRSKVIRLN